MIRERALKIVLVAAPQRCDGRLLYPAALAAEVRSDRHNHSTPLRLTVL